MSDKKYEIDRKYRKTITLDTPDQNEVEVYRIVALIDFGDVEKGDIGGWIQSEDNLSQYGNCWIYGDAVVCEGARVLNNAKVFNDAIVSEHATITEDAKVYNDARVYGYSKIKNNANVFNNASVYDYAVVSGSASVLNYADIHGHALIDEYAHVRHIEVSGDAVIKGNANIRGNGHICDKALICDHAIIDCTGTYAHIGGATMIELRANIIGKVTIDGESIISGDALVEDSEIHDSSVRGNAIVYNNSVIRDNSFITYNAMVNNSTVSLSTVSDHASIRMSDVTDSRVNDKAQIRGRSKVSHCAVYDTSIIQGESVIDGYYRIHGNTIIKGCAKYIQDDSERLPRDTIVKYLFNDDIHRLFEDFSHKVKEEPKKIKPVISELPGCNDYKDKSWYPTLCEILNTYHDSILDPYTSSNNKITLTTDSSNITVSFSRNVSKLVNTNVDMILVRLMTVISVGNACVAFELSGFNDKLYGFDAKRFDVLIPLYVSNGYTVDEIMELVQNELEGYKLDKCVKESK